MSFSESITPRCDETTEIFMRMAGVRSSSNEIAETLSHHLPGLKYALFGSDTHKVSIRVVGHEGYGAPEQYRLKAVLEPRAGQIKLEMVDNSSRRAAGIGKQSLANVCNLAAREGMTSLRAEAGLVHGAAFWARMGFLAAEYDFAKVQQIARQRLHDLQVTLPIDAAIFDRVDQLLDAARTFDPRALWEIVDIDECVRDPYKLEAPPRRLGFALLEMTHYDASLDLSSAEQVGRMNAALNRPSVRPS